MTLLLILGAQIKHTKGRSCRSVCRLVSCSSPYIKARPTISIGGVISPITYVLLILPWLSSQSPVSENMIHLAKVMLELRLCALYCATYWRSGGCYVTVKSLALSPPHVMSLSHVPSSTKCHGLRDPRTDYKVWESAMSGLWAPSHIQLNNWMTLALLSLLFIGSFRGRILVGGWAGHLSAADSDRWESPSRSIDWIRQKPRNEVAANNATRSRIHATWPPALDVLALIRDLRHSCITLIPVALLGIIEACALQSMVARIHSGSGQQLSAFQYSKHECCTDFVV
jgi:hypothetical protein